MPESIAEKQIDPIIDITINNIYLGSSSDETISGLANRNFINGYGGHDSISGYDGLFGNDYLRGGKGNDTIAGSGGNDTIYGDNGNDLISGGEFNDTLYGGEGNDTLYGGKDNDDIFGGIGSDILYGDIGDDFLQGNQSNDFILGGVGNDTVRGGKNDDTVYGNIGDDILYGDMGSDYIYGGKDNDIIYGGEGDDTLRGDIGNDVLVAGTGNNFIYGGEGDDTIYLDSGSDIISGGSGSDIYILQKDFSSISTITDFSSSEDKVDFSNFNLTFTTGGSFNNSVNTVIFFQNNGSTEIHADVNGDSKADFVIKLNGTVGFEKTNLTNVTTVSQTFNTTPEVTDFGGTVAFTEGDGLTTIDNDLIVIDPDNNLTGATVKITNLLDGTLESLAVTDQLGITSSYDSANGILTLTGGSDASDYQTILRTLTYNNTSIDPDSTNRTISIVVSDGSNSPTETATITITPVTFTPSANVLMNSSGGTFNGVFADAIEIAHNDNSLVSNGTLALTFNTNTVTGLQGIYSKDSSGYDTGGHLTLSLSDDDLTVRIQSTTTSYTVTKANVITAGVEYHAAVSFGSGGLKLYLDGVLVGSNAFTGGLVGNYEPAVIGADAYVSGNLEANKLERFFEGTIDNISLYDDELSVGDITSLYNGEGFPIARDDTVYTFENTSIAIDASTLLRNDTDKDGDTLTVSSVSTAINGSVVLSNDGTITYTPNSNFSGTGGFTYTTNDGTGGTDTAKADITILTASGNPSATSVTNSAGGTFNGILADVIEIAHNDNSLLNNGTLELTFNTDTISGSQGIYSKDSSGYDTGGHLTLLLSGNDLVLRIQSTTTTYSITAADVITAGVEYHAAVSFGSGGLKLYLDGALVGSDAYTGGLVGNYEPAVIGASSSSSDNLVANNLKDFFDGTISNVNLYNDELPVVDILALAGGGANVILGSFGDELFFGGNANETIIGAEGADTMFGGGGTDTFLINTITDSGIGSGNRDIIQDFIHGSDKVDISGFAGTFAFIGTGAFSGAQEIRVVSGTNTIIELDSNGDGSKNFEIELLGLVTLDANDFIL